MELKRLYERAREEIENFKLDSLWEVGLDRTLQSYYLIGPYPPLLAMQEPSEKLLNKSLSALQQPVDLYIHFPFCRVVGPYECTFCHFYKECHSTLLEEKYIDACIEEINMYNQKFGGIKVRSIYFGGGSFSLISPNNLNRLLSFIREKLQIEESAEIKFEIHATAARTPDTLKELLSVLKKFRITHIVIDIQSFNEESLSTVCWWGRVCPDDYFETLRMCMAFGFDKFVTGLILGLPFESFETFLRGVLCLATIPQVVTINIFPLMFRKGDMVYDQLHKTPEIFPNVNERDIMNQGARILLNSFGFNESPIYFFNREGTVPSHQISKFEGNTLLGIGPSAFGLFYGGGIAQYYNTPNIDEYFKLISQKIFPIWRVGPLSDLEWKRRRIILGLNMNRPVDMSWFKKSLRNQLLPLVEFFCSLGLLKFEGRNFSFTQKGLLRAEEVSYFFASKRVRNALRTSNRCDDLSRYNYFITRSPNQENLFYKGLEKFKRGERNG